MKKLAIALVLFALVTLVASWQGGDTYLGLIAAAALVCAGTTWQGAAKSSFLKIFAAIFSTETIIFGLCTDASRLDLWPDRFEALKIPDSLPLSVAIFSILVFVVSSLPRLRPMIRIADLYFSSSEDGSARIWPFSRFAAKEHSIAIAMVVFLVLVNQAQVAITVRLSFFNRDWFNAIQAKDSKTFWAQLLVVFIPWAFVYVASAIIEFVVQSMLVIRWRSWLTRYYVGHWLNDHAHYRMALSGNNADNPDQRIAEDVNRFIAGGTEGYGIYSYSILLISTLSSLVSFAIVLWGLSGNYAIPGTDITIPGFLFWVALLYALVGTLVTHVIGRSLVGLYFNRQKVEADFRFSLARLREYSEQVALLSGEPAEKASLTKRFLAVIANYLLIVDRRKKLMAFTAAYEQLSPIIPYIFTAPFYFAGKIELGIMTQTAGAFSRVDGALTFFVTYYTSLADFTAVVDRLCSFDASIDRARAAAADGPRRLPAAAGATAILVDDVTIRLPDGREILSHGGVRFAAGENTLIAGPSGSGKSTLLRAVAGLWPHGSGAITVPAGAHTMIVPQKPYVPNGSLRAAVCYPQPPDTHSDAEIADALKRAKLDNFVSQIDAEDIWSQRMSGGEQQRLAMARAILAKPDWLFLDESTSAVDEKLEGELYRMLTETLPGTTIVSIGHRSTLDAFHTRRLDMSPAGDGTFAPLETRAAAE